MGRLLALLSAVLLAACSAAQGGGTAASAQIGRVRDLAGILTPVEERRLAERLEEAERLYGPEVGIVTVPSLGGEPIAQFTTEYANSWGLGDKDRDDGLLIVVAPNDGQVRIGTGSGIERTYTDDWAQGVINTAMLEHFRQRHWNRGLATALNLIIGHMKRYPTLPANGNAPADASKAA